MTRPSDITRERILKAAERLFADRGYEETSIRAIVAKARVNQAAINYHFGGKDGLYREVLRTAFRALTKQPEGSFLGYRGLLRQAIDRRDWAEATALARKAELAHPGTS